MMLEIGPTPFRVRRPDWPTEEARLAVLWSLHGADLMRATPDPRPWGWLRFAAPPDARRKGPTRDALVADGTITAHEVSLQDATTPPDLSDPTVAAYLHRARQQERDTIQRMHAQQQEDHDE
jgi:hypothetical protein